MSDSPKCPSCESEFAYPDGRGFSCPDCGHEWVHGEDVDADLDLGGVTDANGNLLQDGDTVTVIREPHDDFKKRVPHAIGLIRTGDPTAYGNIILESV